MKEQTNKVQPPRLQQGGVINRLSIGKKVITPHGLGIIVNEEVFRTCERWGVKLDKNPFPFPIAFYFKQEIQCAITVSI